MSDQVSWGIYIANFTFLVGIAAAAVLLVIPAYIFNRSDIKSVVLMSAIAPGLNAYLFASMYQRGVEIAASTVLVTTILAVFTLSGWLVILGG